jgi:transcription factor MYB, plant
MGVDPVTHRPLCCRAESGEPLTTHQQQREDPPHGPASADENDDGDEGTPLMSVAAQPQVAAASPASTAATVSPPCSSSASASVATPGADPVDLFQVDGIMDMDWAGILSGCGGAGISDVDLFDHYPGDGFDDDEQVWM